MGKLIGLAGLARSGKSETAKFLKHKHHFLETSFAAPIRNCVANILGINLDTLEATKDTQQAGFDHTARTMMQTLGTEWGRNMVQEDLWLVSLQNRIKYQRARSGATDIVVSDVRFENEAQMVRDLGGTIWHIRRPEVLMDSTHASERGIVFYPGDQVLLNDGTIGALYAKADALLKA